MLLTPRRVAGLTVVVGLAGLWLVWWLGSQPPGWYPPCGFHAATGLHCPGCGTARAVHAALHGRWLAALHDNALLWIAAPFLVVWFASSLVRAWRLNQWPAPVVGRYAWAALVLVSAFWILRNLPIAPGPWLAPLPLEAVSHEP